MRRFERFVLIACAMTFSLSMATSAVLHPLYAQVTEQNELNDNETTNVTESVVDSFMAQGSVNQLTPLFPSESEMVFLLGGHWVLSVNDGSVDDFTVFIQMVAEDGTLSHIHTIQNLSNVTAQASPVGVNQTAESGSLSMSAGANDTITFSGFADITTNGVREWNDVPVTISLVNMNVLSVIPDPAQVDHFYALPIYGIVASLINESGETLEPELAGETNGTFHGKGTMAERVDAGANDSTSSTADVGVNGMGSAMLDSLKSEDPVTQKLSRDGNYAVQMRWSQSTVYPLPGLSYQVFFLDPVQQNATEDIVPFWESNFTGFSMARPSMFIDPDTLMYFKAVESYDITVYSDAGNILWQSDDLSVYGGRDHGLITLDEEYQGPVSIEITDIKPVSQSPGEGTTPPDSVTFTSFQVK